MKAGNLRSWVLGHCRLGQQQRLLDWEEPGTFSPSPREHESYDQVSQTTPLGDQEDEFLDGFFHVTTNLPGVMSSGMLRSRRSLGDVPGLGGGARNEAPDKVSLTYNSQKAWQIYGAMKFAAAVAHGQIGAPDVLSKLVGDFQVPDELLNDPRGETRSVLARAGVPEPVLDDEFMEGMDEALAATVRGPKATYDFMISMEDALARDFEGDSYEGTPTRVGFTAAFETFAKIDPSSVAILKLEVRKDAPYEHVPQEMELRVAQDDVRLSDNPVVAN